MENKTYKKIYNESTEPLADEIIEACNNFISIEADQASAQLGGVDSRKILFLNALALAGLTRDKVDFTRKTYDVLEGQNLHSANAYYLSPDDDYFLRTPRDEILCNDELYRVLK